MSETTVKVLIVDDDPYITDMYAVKFREAGFTVSASANGKEALAKIAEARPDVLLLDIVMPLLDGFEVLKRLQESGGAGSMKVVILSNLGQREDVERGLALGATDYIIKAHFTPSEVVAKVKNILEQKPA